MPDSSTPVEVFYSYAHEDEAFRDKLEKHLSLLRQQGLITAWHDRHIIPGTDWSQAIDEHLERASVILLLISAEFLASEYCYGLEMTSALQRHEANEARVIPILLRSVDWKSAPFGHLHALPKGDKPITNWSNRDRAFTNVATGICSVIDELSSLQASAPRDTRRYNKKAELLYDHKRYHKALEASEQAIRQKPNDPYCYHSKGKALFDLKSYEEALVAYDDAIRLGSPDPDPQFYRDKGVVYERLAKQAYDNAKAVEWRMKLTLLHTLTGHSQGVFGLAISPDGKLLASGSKDKTIKLWNLQTGQETRHLTKHSERIWSVIFSPNGEFLASGSEDKTIKLWDSQTGQETRTLNDLKSCLQPGYQSRRRASC